MDTPKSLRSNKQSVNVRASTHAAASSAAGIVINRRDQKERETLRQLLSGGQSDNESTNTTNNDDTNIDANIENDNYRNHNKRNLTKITSSGYGCVVAVSLQNAPFPKADPNRRRNQFSYLALAFESLCSGFKDNIELGIWGFSCLANVFSTP